VNLLRTGEWEKVAPLPNGVKNDGRKGETRKRCGGGCLLGVEGQSGQNGGPLKILAGKKGLGGGTWNLQGDVMV